MTTAQADQQAAALRDGDLAGFVSPVLEAIGIDPDTIVSDTIKTASLLLLSLKQLAEDNPTMNDAQLHEAMAALIASTMNPHVMAKALAHMAFYLKGI